MPKRFHILELRNCNHCVCLGYLSCAVPHTARFIAFSYMRLCAVLFRVCVTSDLTQIASILKTGQSKLLRAFHANWDKNTSRSLGSTRRHLRTHPVSNSSSKWGANSKPSNVAPCSVTACGLLSLQTNALRRQPWNTAKRTLPVAYTSTIHLAQATTWQLRSNSPFFLSSYLLT